MIKNLVYFLEGSSHAVSLNLVPFKLYCPEIQTIFLIDNTHTAMQKVLAMKISA